MAEGWRKGSLTSLTFFERKLAGVKLRKDKVNVFQKGAVREITFCLDAE